MGDDFMASADWTRDIPDSEHVRFFRAVDWSASLLGPLEQWSPALRMYTYQVMADSHPSIIYWGPNKVSIYNAEFVPLAGKAHPALMGQTFQQGFPEIWDNIKPVFDGAEQGKMAIPVTEIPLTVERSGYVEETYFTGNFNPLRESDGSVGGFYNVVHEVTKQKLNDRRRAMLNLISFPQRPLTTETLGEYLMSCFRTNHCDVTMALLYRADEDSTSQNCSLQLRGSLGVPKAHPLAVEHANLSGVDGLAPLFRKARSGIITVPVDETFDGITWGGFAEPSRSASIIPLSHGERLYGFLAVGVNPRRPVDEDHEDFMRDISRQVSSTIASTLTAEDAKKRQQRLEKELAESERKIRYLAQHASVAMQHLTTDGTTMWANDHYFALTGASPADLEHTMSFLDFIYEEDRDQTLALWNTLISGETEISHELRFKRLYIPPLGDPEPTSILIFSFPYMEDGKVKSVMSCMTDVSRLKWAEKWQARSAAEAREAKRQQEEFIDSISHEVRNPLSAISQLADTISSSLSRVGRKDLSLEACIHIIDENIEDANTILHCAKHQKSIVDDILTLSKMDFLLISLILIPVKPQDLISEISKIFEADARAYDIEMNIKTDDSFVALDVNWILCDPIRVTQICINLVGNAVKFTKDEEHRRITIRFGIVADDPQKSFSESFYWPVMSNAADSAFPGKANPFERLYLTFSITDTGIGITPEETQRVFQRFEQANTRTFVKYGGSGLGLFISQKLAEKHGGAIGVSSRPGEGSTFVFYVEARRTGDYSSKEHSQRLWIKNSAETSVQEVSASPEFDTSSLPGTPETDSHEQEKTHVLLVEDNIVNQRVLRKQLVQAGYEVYTANHGIEALEILRTTSCWSGKSAKSLPLDVILMDWEMPLMDGLTCSREIRALEASGEITRRVPIIAITANSRKEQHERAIAAGMDDVLSKPFLIKDVLGKISAWVIS